MAPIVRLHLPGDALAMPPCDFPAPQDARLIVDAPGIGLALGSRQDVGRVPVPESAFPALMRAFAPCLGRDGRVWIRPCRAVVGSDGESWIIDLMPAGGGAIPLAPAMARHLQARWSKTAAALLATTAALPAQAATYTVQRGDTLVSIARDHLGSAAGWRHIHALNRQKVPNPHRLLPGTVLELPHSPTPQSPGNRQIVVRPGDTLYSLARQHLGDGNRWGELWQGLRSRIPSPYQLPVGTVIDLPGTMTAAASTLQPAALTLKRSPVPAHEAATAPNPIPQAAAPRVITPQPAVPRIAAPDIEDSRPSSEPDVATGPIQPAAAPLVSEVDDSPATTEPPATTVPPEPVATSNPPDQAPPAAQEQSQPAGHGIERPFASRVGVSYNPVTYHEGFAVQQVTARGTIFNAFGADGAWRVSDDVELSAGYVYNGYPLTRQAPGPDRRTEHQGRAMAYRVWPLSPQLELAAGVGGGVTGYQVQALPPANRPADLYDSDYQRLMVISEGKVGYRPWPNVPLTVNAGLSLIPFGQGFSASGSGPLRLWGVGWTAGLRYTHGGFAVESHYRGQRIFGDAYGQSADMLQAGIGYVFR